MRSISVLTLVLVSLAFFGLALVPHDPSAINMPTGSARPAANGYWEEIPVAVMSCRGFFKAWAGCLGWLFWCPFWV